MENSRVIKSGTILNGKYEIETVLGEGGFGITYRAKDTTLNEIVAIKEYFPSTLGTRDTTAGATNEITIITNADKDAFERGLLRFENEAANLARFNKEPGIVSVKNFFKENNTGYMVMEYIKGITLKDYLASQGGKLPYRDVLMLMKPVMASLAIIHKSSIIHRDISPDNIMVTEYGEMKLIDFGAARYVGNDDEKSLTVMLKAGYAPAEQYHTDGNQGPWTDVYALCATMYKMISGQTPTEAIERVMEGKEIIPLNKLCKEVPERVCKAIEKGMSIDISKRWKSIDEMREGFSAKSVQKKKKAIFLALIASVAVVTIAVVGGLLAIKNANDNSKDKIVEDENATNVIETKNENIPSGSVVSNAGESSIPVGDVVEPIIPDESELYAYTKADIRTSPEGADDNIIRTSEIEEKFEIIEYLKDGWVKVLCDGKEAYIELKYLVSENDLKTWKEYFEVIEEKWNELNPDRLLRLHTEQKGLEGAFDDFDGDGDKELFAAVSYFTGQNAARVWFVDENGVNDLGGIWEYDLMNSGYDPPGNHGYVLPVTIKQVGKIKLCYIEKEKRSGENTFINRATLYINEGEPVIVPDVHLVAEIGGIDMLCVVSDMVGFFESGDDGSIFDDAVFNYYPTLYIDGNWGQVAYCEVALDDFLKINKSSEMISEAEKYFYEATQLRDIVKGYADNRYTGTINNVEPCEVRYNDMGFFVINFKVYGEYDRNLYQEGAYGYSMIKYDGESYEVIYSSFGKMDNFIKGDGLTLNNEIVRFSNCPYIK